MTEQSFEWTLVDPSAAAGAERGTPTGEGLAQFAALVRAAIAEHAPAELAAGSVLVEPGGATFTTITAALASIGDASLKKQYVVYVGAGTYNEVVTCKSWVFIQGADTESTIVSAPGTMVFGNKGTVIGASNAAIQNLTVESSGIGPKSWAMAVTADNVTNFDVENCQLISSDPSGDATQVGLAVDFATGAHSSVVYLAYSSILVDEGNGQGQPLGVYAANSTFLQVTNSKVVARGGVAGLGGAAGFKANLVVDDSYVEGAGYLLKLLSSSATCTANGCQLVGPVYPGVVVNP